MMPLVSSPVVYPSSSSMLRAPSPKKRKRLDDTGEALQASCNGDAARRIGGFLDESDDEDDIAILKEHALKRRMISGTKDLSAIPNTSIDDTPPPSQDETEEPEMVPTDELVKCSFQPQSSLERPAIVHESAPAKYVRGIIARGSSGKPMYIPKKIKRDNVSYEQLIAARSISVEGKAKTSYYGINIHQLMDEAEALDKTEKTREAPLAQEAPRESVEEAISKKGKDTRTALWTEKYRARKFTDLVGDERTHRSVLRWLKEWDTIVFPGSVKSKSKTKKDSFKEEDRKHRKVLLLTGPPGLGKTTLAHVCARQAGYEVQEINASDERSGTVVKGRIRDMVGTENVRGITSNTAKGKVRKAGKPVCVVVDEVDGVVSGSNGGGEGGFIKALVDMIHLDEKNSRTIGPQQTNSGSKNRKGDRFRMLRPLILICNDLYHPSLRLLRQSQLAEIIHIRKPALNAVVTRVQDIFLREGIECDVDAVRRLCEATWGVGTKKEGDTGSGTGEGDIRAVMVVSEWVARRLRSSCDVKCGSKPHLTRKWVQDNVIDDLRHGGGTARGLGGGGAKDVVDRVFREGAGFPKEAETRDARTAMSQAKKGVVGVAEAAKRRAMERLREMIDTSGDCDRIITAYPDRPFQDDTLFSKPSAAYEWLHFHDTLQSAVHGSQEWELAPYLSNSVLAFHDLFASPIRFSPNLTVDADTQLGLFVGPGANFAAAEQLKANRSQLMALQGALSLALARMFRSPEELALDLVPYVLRMLSPDVKPVIVNTGSSGSRSTTTASVRRATERSLVKQAVEAMTATGVRFEKSHVETGEIANRSSGFVWRMEPALDVLASFESLESKRDEKVRYAVRSVLDQEWRKESALRDQANRKRRGGQDEHHDTEQVREEKTTEEKVAEANKKVLQRDFFGRAIKETFPREGREEKAAGNVDNEDGRIWVSFHEGFSNAVRKPVTIGDILQGL